MDPEAKGDRRQLRCAVVPGCLNSTELGSVIEQIIKLHDGYYSAAENIFSSTAYQLNDDAKAFTQRTNERFDNIHSKIERLTDELQQEQRNIRRDINSAFILAAEKDLKGHSNVPDVQFRFRC